jgi:hypothetical protein
MDIAKIKSNPVYKFFLFLCMVIYIVLLLFLLGLIVVYMRGGLGRSMSNTVFKMLFSLAILASFYLYLFISNNKNPTEHSIAVLAFADTIIIVLAVFTFWAYKKILA